MGVRKWSREQSDVWLLSLGCLSRQNSHRAPCGSGLCTGQGGNSPFGLRVLADCTPRLYHFPTSVLRGRKMVFGACSLCKNSHILPPNLCLPSAPQIHPQVTGNLIGRSNLSKILRPSHQCILTLPFSACPQHLFSHLLPNCTIAETCQSDQRLSLHWALALSPEVPNGGIQSLQPFW